MSFTNVHNQNSASDPAQKAAVKVVEVLHAAGHVAYLAGGCVRDMLLGLMPKDYDVATDAKPDAVIELFRNARYVGEAFGVVLVRLLQAEIEVATFRTEWGYEDGRHPTHVEFTDAENDSRRRDFTINGLFFDPLTNTVHDFVGGQADLQNRLIRAIGDPEARFGEDYLRMLRAVRFAARYDDFSLDSSTAEAIKKHANDLRKISRERIGMEIEAMLTHPNRGKAVRMLGELDLEVPCLMSDGQTTPTLLNVLDTDGCEYATALATWMLDRHVLTDTQVDGFPAQLQRCDGPGIASRWRKALVLSNDTSEALRVIPSQLHHVFHWRHMDRAARKRLLAGKHWLACETLLAAANRCGLLEEFDYETWQTEAATLRVEGIAPTPFINGQDLINLDLSPGPAFKRILDALYDDQLRLTITTRDEALKALDKLRADLGE